MVIGGEAGIGKTRLVDEFAMRVAVGMTLLSGSCLPTGGRATPYAPFVEALRLHPRRRAGPAARAAGAWRRELGRLLPELEAGSPGLAGAEPLVDTDLHGQARLFEAILAFLHAVSRSAPCVVIVDDLQWADSGTLELLSSCCATRAGRGCSSSCSSGPTTSTEPGRCGTSSPSWTAMPAWTGWSSDRSTARRAATCSLPGVAALTSGRLADLTRRAGGNPFYLEQLATGSDGVADGDRSLTLACARCSQHDSRTFRRGPGVLRGGRRWGRVDDEILAAVLEAPHAEVRRRAA